MTWSFLFCFGHKIIWDQLICLAGKREVINYTESSNYKKDNVKYELFLQSLWTTLEAFVPKTNKKPVSIFLRPLIRPQVT